MSFLTGVAPSTIAVLLSLVLFIFLTYKGLDLIPVALLSSVVVAFTAKSGFFGVLFGTFMTETAAYPLCRRCVFLSAQHAVVLVLAVSALSPSIRGESLPPAVRNPSARRCGVWDF